MSVDDSILFSCLRSFNPWWETGDVPDAWASRFERDALPGIAREYAERDAGRGLVLIGPRRVGKSTIAYQVVRGLLRAGTPRADICFVLCDDPRLKGVPLIDVLRAYETLHGEREIDDPRVRHLFLDEIQHEPDWPLWLKQIADRRLPYRFLATGSSATALRTGGSSAGIGRWRERLLLPLSLREFAHLHPTRSRAFPHHDRLADRLRADPERLFADDLGAWVEKGLGAAERHEVDRLSAALAEYLLFGGFPEVASIDSLDEARRRIVNDVILRTLASDVALAHGVEDPNAIEKLFLRLCASSGGLWSDSKESKELGVSRPTVARYMRFLEDASLALRFENLAKAQRGMPKLYVVDPAVRAALLVIGREGVQRPETLGPLLENAIVAALFGAREGASTVGFWRRDRAEVDAVLARWGRRGLLIEVKTTLREGRHRAAFEAAADDLRAYNGTFSYVALHTKTSGRTSKSDGATVQELHPATFLYTFSAGVTMALDSSSKDPALNAINVSLPYDRRLWREDLDGSLAHVRMLAAQGIIAPAEAIEIARGLGLVRAEIEAGTFPFRDELEDIHLNVEKRLTELVGPVGGKLHTGRSRNDQVATDMRLFVRREAARLDAEVRGLALALLEAAERELAAGTALPFYTHLQRAQPVLLAHHLHAHTEALWRDRGRIADAARRADECPLGAGPGAGSGFPVDPAASARALGFSGPFRNSLDAVAARDFVVEMLAAFSTLMTHLSRLAEEMILWSTAEFGFVRFSDPVTTGSSIMPQKRNPDGAELVRGKTGRVHGHLVGMLVTIKALPLAYNKDLQEDKESFFDALDTVRLSLAVLVASVRGATFARERMREAASEREGYANATELADWLTQKGLPFREAYGVAARLVARARDAKVRLEELPIEALRAESPLLDESVREKLTVDAAIARRAASGGTAPGRVREALADARGRWVPAEDDASAIRALFDEWRRATLAGEHEKVLALMSDDVVFLLAGQPPMRGRSAFAAMQKSMPEGMKIDASGELEEVIVRGDVAYARGKLDVKVSLPGGREVMRRAGYSLTVYERRGGKWVLVRDANLMAPV